MILRNFLRTWKPITFNGPQARVICCRHITSEPSAQQQLTKLREQLQKPAQPVKPFLRFLLKYKTLFIAKYPTAGTYELLNRLAAVWCQLTPDAKKLYYDHYWNDAVRYYKFAEDFKNNDVLLKERLVELEKEVREEMRLKKQKRFVKQRLKPPRKLANPFIFYVIEKCKEHDGKTPFRLVETLAIASKEWHIMSKEDKKKYVDQYKEEREQYSMEIANWECDLIKKGYAHLLPKHKFFDTRPTNVRGRRSKENLNVKNISLKFPDNFQKSHE